MKIDLCHHYWKNRANAQWFPEHFPCPQIEHAVKREYPLLISERPRWKTWDGITVFFDYQPDKDIYGREIVPVSFAFLPGCVNPEACWQRVSPALAKAPRTSTSIDVDIPAGFLHTKQVKRKKTLLGFAVLACLCASLFWFWPTRESTITKGSEVAPPTIEQAREIQGHSSTMLGRGGAKSHVGGNTPSSKATLAQAPPIIHRENLHDICGQDWKDKLVLCPRLYIKQLCNPNSQEPFLSFENWRSEHGDECHRFPSAEWVLWEGKTAPPFERYIYILDTTLDDTQINLLRSALQLREK